MITIIDYGMGNIQSVKNAFDFLGVKTQIITDPEALVKSQKLILPGVGSFKKAMENLNRVEMLPTLNELVLIKKVPVLGICLGMQLFSAKSDEDGATAGLGWIRGECKNLSLNNKNIKTPHIGFNDTYLQKEDSKMLNGLKKKTDFYYVHSYQLLNSDVEIAYTIYGNKITAAIEQDNIWGCQFHPEKSQTNGLVILKNFANI